MVNSRLEMLFYAQQVTYAFYGSGKFITVFTRPSNGSLLRTGLIQSTSSKLLSDMSEISKKAIIILCKAVKMMRYKRKLKCFACVL